MNALYACPHCNGAISRTSRACPSCGAATALGRQAAGGRDTAPPGVFATMLDALRPRVGRRRERYEHLSEIVRDS